MLRLILFTLLLGAVIVVVRGVTSERPAEATTTKSYVVFGDSLSYWSEFTSGCGAGYDCPFGFVRTFEHILEAREPGVDYVVTNYGKPCMPSNALATWITEGTFTDPGVGVCGQPEEEPIPDEILDAIEHADVITFDTGMADLLGAGNQCHEEPDPEECFDDRVATFQASWDEIVAFLVENKQEGAEVYSTNLYYTYVEDDLMNTNYSPNKFEVLSGVMDEMNAHIAGSSSILPIADMHSAFNGATGEFDPHLLGFVQTGTDTLHHTPRGADRFAEEFCLAAFSVGSANNDGEFIDQTPPLTQDDTTRPMGDAVPDDCDVDDDNDGLWDTIEVDLPGSACASATGALDPFNPDSDGDGILDGAECAIGTNPNSSSSKPNSSQCAALAGAATASTDNDGDRIADSIEVCGYHTLTISNDSDGDGYRDGCEVASLNTLPPVNSGDQLLLAQAILADLSGAYVYNADLNKTGDINSGDQLLWRHVFLYGGC